MAGKKYFEKYDISMKHLVPPKPEGEKKRGQKQQRPLPSHVQRTVFQQLEKQERNGWFRGIGVVFDGIYILHYSYLH
jgi:hypothetical protein